MGQMFGQLTNPGTALMSGASGGEPLFIGTPSQVQQHLNQSRDAVIKSGINNPVMNPKPQPAFPTQGTPTFQQAATSGAQPGGANALSPGLNKAGKLMTLLTSGLQGALAGRAASEQATVASGGRRSGGAGMGFEAAQAYPWQQLSRQLGAEQQAAQTGVLQSEAQNVNIPGMGPIPGWLAKAMGPAYLRQQGTLGAAQTRAGAEVQGKDIQGQTARDVARINQGEAIPVDETTANLAGFPALAGQSAGRATWTNINKALEAKGYRVQDMGENGTGPNQGMWLMDRAGNRIRQTSPNSLVFQRGASFAQNRPEVVVDPNDPGYAYYTTAANAMRNNLPAPQGAGTVAAKAEARSEVPTKVGDQKVAFKTALQHADLLSNAMKALSNGDQQTLNRLKNSFANEFGATGPISAQAIADAYTREVTKMLSSGHLTDSEVATVGKTLDPQRQSLQQVAGVLSAYRALAQSKLNMLNQQADAAKNPRANSGGGPTAADMLKKYPPK